MSETWRDHWGRLTALQERIEQHATGRDGKPVDANADFASFLVESENLRDGVKNELERRNVSATLVDEEMKAIDSLRLAHDLAIKVKHEVQSEPPWSGATDAEYHLKVSMGLREANWPFGSRSRSTSLPGTRPPPPQEPRRWAHQWEISYTPLTHPTHVLDGVRFSRDIIDDWHTILTRLTIN